MEEPIVSDNIVKAEEGTDSLHIYTSEYDCFECKNSNRQYVQILDMDRFIKSLNDWD